MLLGLKLLMPSERKPIRVRFDKEDGISPEKELFRRANSVRLVRLPSEDGNGPLNLQAVTSKSSKEWRFPMEAGKTPDKLVNLIDRNLSRLHERVAGNVPLRCKLLDTSRNWMFGKWKMDVGSFPNNPQ
ncbi:hypothetical protein V6Z12_D09G068200 [Gossypium hirsutum]